MSGFCWNTLYFSTLGIKGNYSLCQVQSHSRLSSTVPISELLAWQSSSNLTDTLQQVWEYVAYHQKALTPV